MSEKAGLIFLKRCVDQNRMPDMGDLKLILRDYKEDYADVHRMEAAIKHLDASATDLLRQVKNAQRENKKLLGAIRNAARPLDEVLRNFGI